MAQGKYTFKIDGSPIPDPEGWEEMEESIERVGKDIKVILKLFNNSFVFRGNGYDAIFNRMEDTPMGKSKIEVLQDNSLIFEGVFLHGDIKINEEKRTAEINVEDASFNGAINNNKQAKANVDAEISRNAEPITAAESTLVDFFNVSTGNSTGQRTGFEVVDVLGYLCRYITDGDVSGCKSDFLADFTGSGYKIFLFSGLGIRSGAATDVPYVSFQDLFTSLSRLLNLGMGFEKDADGLIWLRVEKREFFFDNTEVLTINDVVDLNISLDISGFYSAIKVGSVQWSPDGKVPTNISWNTFKTEQYTLEGQSNIDSVLDLTSVIVVDSNSIQNTAGGDNDLDEETFMVVAEPDGSNWKAVKYTDPDFHYNNPLMNKHVVANHGDGIPASAIKYLSANNTAFKVVTDTVVRLDFIHTKTPFAALIEENINPIAFNVNSLPDAFDLGANFNTTLFEYVVPFSETYSFHYLPYYSYTVRKLNNVICDNQPIVKMFIRHRIRHEDSQGNLIDNYDLNIERDINGQDACDQGRSSFLTSTAGVRLFSLWHSFNHVDTGAVSCSAGDKLKCSTRVRSFHPFPNPSPNTVYTRFVLRTPDTRFWSAGGKIDDDQQEIQPFTPDATRLRVIEFERGLSQSDFDALKDNPNGAIAVRAYPEAQKRKGWIENVTRNRNTGVTNFKLKGF